MKMAENSIWHHNSLEYDCTLALVSVVVYVSETKTSLLICHIFSFYCTSSSIFWSVDGEFMAPPALDAKNAAAALLEPATAVAVADGATELGVFLFSRD